MSRMKLRSVMKNLIKVEREERNKWNIEQEEKNKIAEIKRKRKETRYFIGNPRKEHVSSLIQESVVLLGYLMVVKKNYQSYLAPKRLPVVETRILVFETWLSVASQARSA